MMMKPCTGRALLSTPDVSTGLKKESEEGSTERFNYRLNPPARGAVLTAAGPSRWAVPVEGVAARGGLGVR